EEIWQQLPHEGASITIAAWPKSNSIYQNDGAVEEMAKVMSSFRSVRNLREEVDTPMSRKVTMMIQTQNDAVTEELEGNRLYIERFCNTDTLTISSTIDTPEEAMSAVITGAELFLPLAGLIDEIGRASCREGV